MKQALAYPPFGHKARRHTGRDEPLLNADVADASLDLLAADPVPVPDQEACRLLIGERLHDLSCCPLGGPMHLLPLFSAAEMPM